MSSLNKFVLFKISSKEFANTLAASGVSLATVISFFISTYYQYGFILLLCIPTYLAGNYVFALALDKFKINLKANRTVGEVVKDVFQSPLIANMVDFVNLSALISIIFLELYIGSQILSMIFNNVSAFVLFISIAVFTFIYVRHGGFKAVIRSDSIQLTLITISFILLTIYSFTTTPFASTSIFSLNYESIIGVASTSEAMTLLLVMVMINFLMPFTSITHWHRVVATENYAQAKTGVKQSIIKVTTTWGLPILLVAYLLMLGYNITNIGEFFEAIFFNDSITAMLLKYLVSLSFIACIMSSIDTAIIAIVFTLKSTIANKSKNEVQISRNINYTILGVFITQVLLYACCLTTLKHFVLFATFTIFGQLVILFPLVITSLYCLYQKRVLKIKFINQLIIAFAILIGLATIFVLTYISDLYATTFWSQIAPLVSLSVIAITLLLTLPVKQKKSTDIKKPINNLI